MRRAYKVFGVSAAAVPVLIRRVLQAIIVAFLLFLLFLSSFSNFFFVGIFKTTTMNPRTNPTFVS